MITIYTDGSYRKKISAASSAVVIILSNGQIHTEHKYIGSKTNNYAELFAVKMALSWCYRQRLTSEKISIFSDSTYAIGITTGKMNPKVNLELAEEASQLFSCFKNLEISWVKSHSTNKYNKLADTMANISIDQHHNLTENY